MDTRIKAILGAALLYAVAYAPIIVAAARNDKF
jgi:hypothetical protein